MILRALRRSRARWSPRVGLRGSVVLPGGHRRSKSVVAAASSAVIIAREVLGAAIH